MIFCKMSRPISRQTVADCTNLRVEKANILKVEFSCIEIASILSKMSDTSK